MSNRTKNKTRKGKRVTIDETINSVRTLSKETKEDNRTGAKEIKNLVWLRQNNVANGDETNELGIDEIPRLSKSQRKEYIRKTLDEVKLNESKPKSRSLSGCTICGGKHRRTRKHLRSRKHRSNNKNHLISQ